MIGMYQISASAWAGPASGQVWLRPDFWPDLGQLTLITPDSTGTNADFQSIQAGIVHLCWLLQWWHLKLRAPAHKSHLLHRQRVANSL